MKHQNTAYYNFFCWTEAKRLQAVKDKYMGAFYNYDATGERNLKLTGSSMDVTQNGTTVNVPVFDQQTLYASALVTINDKGYTKHYFEEGKRICSKIGGGELKDVDLLVEEFWDDYDKQRDYAIDGITKTYDQCMGMVPYINNQDLYTYIIKKYEEHIDSNEPAFYYHGDHLSSASYITDENGNATQQIVYLPFGEDWVDLKYNTSQFETPFKFNGKEKDEETSYNYYGARYYYDHLSIFLSVDPMSDKYPHLSPYAYCANNPIMLIDPDGRDSQISIEGETMYIRADIYAKKGKDAERAKEGAKSWNDQKDYVYSKGGKDYNVKFEINVIESDDAFGDYSKAKDTKDNKANFFQIGETTQGSVGNASGDFISVAKNSKTRTPAHEIGHILGLGEWSKGLMDSKGSFGFITPGNIKGILNRGGINVGLDENLIDDYDYEKDHKSGSDDPGKVSTSTIDNSLKSGGVLRNKPR